MKNYGPHSLGATETEDFVTSYLYLVPSSTSILGRSCLKKCLENIKYWESVPQEGINPTNHFFCFCQLTVIAYCLLGQESKRTLVYWQFKSLFTFFFLSLYVKDPFSKKCGVREKYNENCIPIPYGSILGMSFQGSDEGIGPEVEGSCTLHIKSQVRLPWDNNKVGGLRVGYQLSRQVFFCVFFF